MLLGCWAPDPLHPSSELLLLDAGRQDAGGAGVRCAGRGRGRRQGDGTAVDFGREAEADFPPARRAPMMKFPLILDRGYLRCGGELSGRESPGLDRGSLRATRSAQRPSRDSNLREGSNEGLDALIDPSLGQPARAGTAPPPSPCTNPQISAAGTTSHVLWLLPGRQQCDQRTNAWDEYRLAKGLALSSPTGCVHPVSPRRVGRSVRGVGEPVRRRCG